MIVSQNLQDNLDLWLWDFDDTLIDTSTYFRQSMKPKDILKRTDVELDKEIPSWRYFKKLVKELFRLGKRIGIVSFGTGKIIQAYMNRIFGMNQLYFHRNNILALCRDKDGRPIEYFEDKNSFIYTLMDYYRIEDIRRVVLFDDRMINIVNAAKIGVIAVKIPGRKSTTGHPEFYSVEDSKFKIKNQYLFNEKTIKKLDDGIMYVCPVRHTFSGLGDRKVNSRANVAGIDLNYDGKIIEAFGCPCTEGNWSILKVFICAILFFFIMMIITRNI